jgi:hypothetical protein
MHMKNVTLKAFAGFFAFLVIAALALFIPAWTIAYWQAWLFLVVFFTPCLVITIYLMKKDPKLLERRITVGPTDEKETSQKIIQFFAQFSFLLILILPALDHRYGWSVVWPYVNAIGDVLIVAGF